MIEQELVSLLKDKQLVITTAESCTGGMIASRIVSVPGASAVFKEGYITYSDEVKSRVLGVKKSTLEQYFAVSAETAGEMAEGAAKIANADIAISVTGVAGPDKEDGKPVGLVYIGCSYKGRISVREYNFTGERADIRNAATDEALKFAADIIKNN